MKFKGNKMLIDLPCALTKLLLVCVLLYCGPSVAAQEDISSYGTDFYIGFMRNVGGTFLTQMRLTIGTTAERASYVIETVNNVFEYQGEVTFGNVEVVEIPNGLQVTGSDIEHRMKGIHVRSTNDQTLIVLAENFVDPFNHGVFLAYPCLTFEVEDKYEYFILSTKATKFVQSQFLIVGCEDNTTVTVVPSRTVLIPEHITSSESLSVDSGATSHEFSVSRMQTLLVSSENDLSGTKILSSKPLTIISGHECANVPFDASACEPLAIQVPPSITLGNSFLLPAFAGRTSEQRFKIVSDEETSFSIVCANRPVIGGILLDFFQDFQLTSYCYLETSRPALVAEISSGGSLDRLGDPAISLIAPIDQYVKEVSFIALRTNDFPLNWISVTVTAEHYEPSNILLDDVMINCAWVAIQNSDSEVVGYGCNTTVTSGATFPMQHTVSHRNGLVSVLVYGFRPNPGLGYAYLAGQKISSGSESDVDLELDFEFLPFFDLDPLPDVRQLPHTLDAISEQIIVPDGFIFGDKLVTRAFVNENGVISFNKPWKYSNPDRFPTNYFWTRKGLAIAPFWSDNDIRKEGEVKYVSYCNLTRLCKISPEGQTVLDDANKFVQKAIQVEGVELFIGHWVLVAHWDHVHPSPHGDVDHNGIPDDVLNQYNNYQAVIVSNTIDTYVIFTYMCGEIQWSTVGGSRPAVVGFNSEGVAFENHPQSGYGSIGNAVSCVVELGKRKRRNTRNITINGVTKVYTETQFLNLMANCTQAFKDDLGLVTIPEDEFGMLKNNFNIPSCPTIKILTELNEIGRFMKQADLEQECYITTNPIKTDLRQSGSSVSVTQQCCYNLERGALETKPNVGYAGTLLLYHPHYDKDMYDQRERQFRDKCCAIDDCDKYFSKRQIDNGTEYQGLAFGSGTSDPHFATLNGKRYDFQGEGEFVTLELLPNNPPQFMLQGRQKVFPFEGWLPASWHVAVAFGRLDLAFQINLPFRLYQTRPGPAVDITDKIPANGISLEFIEKEVVFIRNSNELRIGWFKTGVVIIVKEFSSSGRVNGQFQEMNYFDVHVGVPRTYKGRTRGLLGVLGNDKNNDLFARDGDSSLNDLNDEELFQPLLSWRVREKENLFFDMVRSKRQSPDSQLPIFFDDLDFTEEQQRLCSNNPECLLDLVVTGVVDIALTTLNQQRETNRTIDLLSNSPPSISAESSFRVNVGKDSVLIINVVDPGDNFTLDVEGGLPDNSVLQEVLPGVFMFRWTLLQATNNPLVFIANDTRGASSLFAPSVEVCACVNGGNCSSEGILSNNATIILNCLCDEAFDGRFCEEDRNGCSEIQCFEGVECMDVPAPGVGAVCEGCPLGYTGDSLKCYDIDECSLNDTLCHQFCNNTEGSYFCSCRRGYQLSAVSNRCEDINECTEVNDCQQICENTLGSYDCRCMQGFTLENDGRNCTADIPCDGTCSFGCAVIDEIEQCFCPVGFLLDVPDGTNCVDLDECEIGNPCDQICTNTEGSYECSCNEGYETQDDRGSCIDIDECFEAALQSVNLCESDINSQCINSKGSFQCVCVAGYITNKNGSCELIENEPSPPPPPVIRPASSEDNSVNYTAPVLTADTFTPERRQRFRQVAAEAVTNYCSAVICDLIIDEKTKQRVDDLKVDSTNIALPSSLIFENEEGQLVFTLYIQFGDGFLSIEQLEPALMQAEENFRTAGFLIPHPTTPPATQPPTTEPTTQPLMTTLATTIESTTVEPTIKVNCDMEADTGSCFALIPRYFFNTKTGTCEMFTYGGCGGNGNNYKTLQECTQQCNPNGCPPYCTVEYCSAKSTRTALCTLREPEGVRCDAKCRVTYCHTCYYDDEYRPLPRSCKTCSRVEIELEARCFRKWAVCTRRADGQVYLKVRARERTSETFKCYEHPCA